MKVLLLVAFCAGALAAPSKLGEHHDHDHHHHHHEDPLALVAAEARDAQGYNYDPPAEPSGLYDLPEPTTTTTTPPPPPPTTTTTTTTTTTPPPPPPVDSYLPPQLDTGADEPKPVTVLPPTPSPPKAETTMMPMPFEFKYDVADEVNGVQMAHDTDSDGIVTVGEYSVLLPDGRMQVVKYRVTPEDGYQAEVTYV